MSFILSSLLKVPLCFIQCMKTYNVFQEIIILTPSIHILLERSLKAVFIKLYTEFTQPLDKKLYQLRVPLCFKMYLFAIFIFLTHLIENLSYISDMQSVFRKRTPMLVKIAILFGYLKQFRPLKKKKKLKIYRIFSPKRL